MTVRSNGDPMLGLNRRASLRKLLKLAHQDDEEDEEEDEDEDDDYDPEHPDEGVWLDDNSSSDEYGSKRKREDPVRYVPPRKKLRAKEDGEEEETNEEVKIDAYFPQVMKQCTMIMSRVMGFLSLKERLLACSVCHAWNSPLLNYHQDRLDFSQMTNITDKQFMTLLPKYFGPRITHVTFDGISPLIIPIITWKLLLNW